MWGDKSEGRRSAKGIVVVRRRAAMRGASSARGMVRTNSVLWGRVVKVGERVDVDGAGGVAPGLELLGNLLCVWRGENTNDPSVFEGFGEIVQKSEDSVVQTGPAGARTRGSRRG